MRFTVEVELENDVSKSTIVEKINSIAGVKVIDYNNEKLSIKKINEIVNKGYSVKIKTTGGDFPECFAIIKKSKVNKRDGFCYDFCIAPLNEFSANILDNADDEGYIEKTEGGLFTIIEGLYPYIDTEEDENKWIPYDFEVLEIS